MSSSAIRAYLKEIAAIQSGGEFTEHSFRGALQKLLQALLPGVDITNEPGRIMEGGAPDYVLKRDLIPLGYIEAKDIDKSLDNLSGREREQFQRYLRSLDNIVFTNYLEFRFYRDGDSDPVNVVSIAELIGGKIKPSPSDFEQFTDSVKNFGAYEGQTITTAIDLAERMASKARLLADAIETALAEKNEVTDNRSLEAQLQAFKKLLVADISIKDFAGAFAQTIAYGMFAARLHDPTLANFSRDKAAKLIPSSNPFLKKFFGYIAAFDLDARIKWIVDDLADIFRAADVAELMKNFGKSTQRTDPFIHFYETFLGQYDKKQRKSRGVYYTPEPAVNFIVRAVDEILKKEFKLPRGLADAAKTQVTTSGAKKKKQTHKVQILDPAAGTGTFLAEVVKQVREKFAAQQGGWPDYVKKELLPRLSGFEILMAPYAMAHLKLEMALRDTGCELDGERIKIYLTNALEEHHADSEALFGAMLAVWLADESREADEIKRDVPVMVVMGNPPYSVSSVNRGKWIDALTKDYKEGLGETNIQPLSDDYIKFIRYGQFMVEKNGEGILAYISNNSFIDGLIHRRMRERLLQTFDRIYILDLHGDTRKKERAPDGSKDQNVFDIMQGVSINLFVKSNKKRAGAHAEVFHFDVFGVRQSKYDFLWGHALGKVKFRKLQPRAPHFFFVPKDFSAQAEYEEGFAVNELFNEYNSGIKTERDRLTVAFSVDDIRYIKKDMKRLDAEEIRRKYRLSADGRDWKVALAKQDIEENDPEPVSVLYRPFDLRHTFYTGNAKGFIGYPRHKTMRHMLGGENFGFMTSRSYSADEIFDRVFVTRHIADLHAASDQTYFFPLYLYLDEKDKRVGGGLPRKPNLNADIVGQIADKTGLRFTPETNGGRDTFAPLDLLDYLYAALYSPAYRKKFREFLKIDFPRVPYPRDKKHFRALAKLGAELRQLHLMTSVKLERMKTTYPQTGDDIVTKIVRKKNTVWLNKTQRFERVPEIAWNFAVGGYFPAQKYLKDRKGRTLSWNEIHHYQKIIVALVETAKVMEKIDAVA